MTKDVFVIAEEDAFAMGFFFKRSQNCVPLFNSREEDDGRRVIMLLV